LERVLLFHPGPALDHDPLTYASHVAGITDMNHHTSSPPSLFKHKVSLFRKKIGKNNIKIIPPFR
jgi:hypothetical protein